jgi:hypothetical protein
MEGDDSPGAKSFGDFSKDCGRVTEVHEHEPANSRVKEPPAVGRARVRLTERNVGDALCLTSLLSEFNGLSVQINSDDRAVTTDKVGHKEADIANTATDVEHMHPALNSGRDQHPLGKGPKQFGLLDQTLVFAPCTTKRVISVIHRSITFRHNGRQRSAEPCTSTRVGPSEPLSA